jgi:hypothetical protein
MAQSNSAAGRMSTSVDPRVPLICIGGSSTYGGCQNIHHQTISERTTIRLAELI